MDLREKSGQASVELLAAVPLAAVVLLAGWQVVIAGHTWWKLQEAARIAARIAYVAGQRGEPSAGLARARRVAGVVLASSPPGVNRVRVYSNGDVRLTTRVPLVEPFRSALGARGGPRLSATSGMHP